MRYVVLVSINNRSRKKAVPDINSQKQTIKNYYEILEISRDADQNEIKNAYRRLAKQWHPDVCPDEDAHRRFVEISEAYEILRDPGSRRTYDHLLADYEARGGYDTGESFADFRRKQEQAHRTAEQYATINLDDVLGYFVDMAVSAGRQVWNGHDEAEAAGASFYTGHGFLGWMIIFRWVFSRLGISKSAPPPLMASMYNIMLDRNHRFMGVAAMLKALAVAGGLAIACGLGLLLLVFVLIL